jgi:hypothetical protein
MARSNGSIAHAIKIDDNRVYRLDSRYNPARHHRPPSLFTVAQRSSQGVSKWLFVGQITASIGFVVYSYLLRNWVFVVTNVLMLLTALLGQWIYLTNKQRY